MPIESARDLCLHSLATLGCRGGKAFRGVPDNHVWYESAPQAWDQEVERFSTALAAFDAYIANDAPLQVPLHRRAVKAGIGLNITPLKLPHIPADYPIGTMCLLVLLQGLGKIGLREAVGVV